MRASFYLITFCLFVHSLQAQEIPVPATLKHFVGQSFQKYPRVGEMTNMVHMNEVRVSLGKAGYLPIAGVNLSYTRLYPTPAIDIPMGSTVQSFRIAPADNYNASVSIAQPILDLRTPAAVNKAKSELETSKDNLDGFKIQLAYQVAQIYYSIIFLNKSLAVQKEQIGLLQSTLQQINVKVNYGDALKYDLVSTQVKYTNAENFYTDLQTQLGKQYNLLGMLTGISGSGSVNADTVVRLLCTPTMLSPRC